MIGMSEYLLGQQTLNMPSKKVCTVCIFNTQMISMVNPLLSNFTIRGSFNIEVQVLDYQPRGCTGIFLAQNIDWP